MTALAMPRPPAVEVVVLVYNEERDLAQSVRRLHEYLATEFPFTFRITIADDATELHGHIRRWRDAL